MKATVTVTLKNGVLDPQGAAVKNSLCSLGFEGVADTRIGKVIELELAEGTTKDEIAQMCEKLLANTVIEDFEIEL